MRNMTTSIMTALLLTSLLAILAIAAQARSLSGSSHNIISMITEYGRPYTTPPPGSTSAPPVRQITSAIPCVSGSTTQCSHNLSNVGNYEKNKIPPATPPPPKLSPSPQQLTVGYERTSPSTPPSPKPSSPSGQLENGSPCMVGTPCSRFITLNPDYGKNKPRTPPPTPKPSPSEHQLTSVKQILLLHRTSSDKLHQLE